MSTDIENTLQTLWHMGDLLEIDTDYQLAYQASLEDDNQVDLSKTNYSLT